MAGGKRLRPCLLMAAADAICGDGERFIKVASAIEMIHTYSLIHDDLPCMDDDDFRRGKPSCHIAFGEANALLAGDGLLTLAFLTITKADLPAEYVVKACAVLSQAAGICGMIGGQVMDLENEGRTVETKTLEKTDELKTGELIRCACELGCIAAGADDKQIDAARRYARGIGIAFQIVDDILDVTSDTETLGKPVGSDDGNRKSTYVSVLGLDKARQLAIEYTSSAKAALSAFECGTAALDLFADKMLNRKN